MKVAGLVILLVAATFTASAENATYVADWYGCGSFPLGSTYRYLLRPVVADCELHVEAVSSGTCAGTACLIQLSASAAVVSGHPGERGLTASALHGSGITNLCRAGGWSNEISCEGSASFAIALGAGGCGYFDTLVRYDENEGYTGTISDYPRWYVCWDGAGEPVISAPS